MNQNKLLLNILNYIEDNLYSKISIDDLSRIFYFNKDYIMRIFKKKFNVTIINYINKKRVYNSLQFLKDTNDKILKIAIKYGFTSQEYYCEIFKKIMGVSPTKYRNFTRVNTSISINDIHIIRKNLINLNNQIKIIDKYKISTKKETVKKLSLFK